MITSILQEMNSPTLGRETPCKGGLIYETIENSTGQKFKVKIEYVLQGNEVVDSYYKVLGDHGIPLNYLNEIVMDIILKAI